MTATLKYNCRLWCKWSQSDVTSVRSDGRVDTNIELQSQLPVDGDAESKQRPTFAISEEGTLIDMINLLPAHQLQALHHIMTATAERHEWGDFAGSVNVADAPLYPYLVPYAMDLVFIKDRLESGYYRQLAAVLSDVDAIYIAAITFNRADSDIAQLAKQLTDNVHADIASSLHGDVPAWYARAFDAPYAV